MEAVQSMGAGGHDYSERNLVAFSTVTSVHQWARHKLDGELVAPACGFL